MLDRFLLLDPIPKGVATALLAVLLATLGAYFFLAELAPASPELLRTLATIGAALLIAYVVEAVWLVPQIETDEDHEEWLGFITGAGIAGLLGVAFSVLLSAHREAGHDNVLDDLGLAWTATSLLILGGVLVLQPLLADRYRGSGGPTAG